MKLEYIVCIAVIIILAGSALSSQARDEQGEALFAAAKQGNLDAIKALLADGVDVNKANPAGVTTLHVAAGAGQKEICAFLLDKGADMNARAWDSQTPLHWAVQAGHKDVTALLLEKGADVDVPDRSGRTPLLRAYEEGYPEIIELLRKHTHIPPPSEASFTDTTPDLILTAESPEMHTYGIWPECGDVNGDGYDDCLVTAFGNQGRGKGYLYFGEPGMNEHPDRIFVAENVDEKFGMATALGDVNGDKYADVIIGAQGYNDDQGRVYIYYGSPVVDTDVDLILEGEPGTSGIFGRVIDTGDVDNDSCDDIVVVATHYSNSRGRAYLYYGGDPMDTIADKVFDGEHPGDIFGREMDMGPDVNGDGYGDILFGCRGWNPGPSGHGQGRAYLYYGGPKESMDEKCDRVFTGEKLGDEFGSSVCLFDIDNDGYADVLIGAREYGDSQGRMYLYWGSSDLDTNADLIFDGEAGKQTSMGGDNIDCGYFNGDKYGDIVIGAYNYSGRSRQGRVYLYYGGPRTSMDTVCDHTFTGETGTIGNMYGVRSGVGDLNGDNMSDLVVGAPWYTSDSRMGRAYVYYTKPFPLGGRQKAVESRQQVPTTKDTQPE